MSSPFVLGHRTHILLVRIQRLRGRCRPILEEFSTTSVSSRLSLLATGRQADSFNALLASLTALRIVAAPTAIRTEEPPVSKLREEPGWALAVLARP